MLREYAARIRADGGQASAHVCDLADMAAIDGLVVDVEAELGGIDILVNNAGRSIRRPLAESLERWHDVERTIALNYYGPLRLIRGLCPGMRERGDGHVINVATWGRLLKRNLNFQKSVGGPGGSADTNNHAKDAAAASNMHPESSSASRQDNTSATGE